MVWKVVNIFLTDHNSSILYDLYLFAYIPDESTIDENPHEYRYAHIHTHTSIYIYIYDDDRHSIIYI